MKISRHIRLVRAFCLSKIVAIGGIAVIAAAFFCDSLSADDFAEAHRDAVNRQRRIIFNNDGGETSLHMTEPTAANFLEQRTNGLVGTDIDTIVYCTRTSGFGLFTHATKVGAVFTTREGRYSNNQTAAMHKAGLDPLSIMIDFARKHEKEIFWSMRMNDTHDGTKNAYAGHIFQANPLKVAHPEYLMGTKGQKLKQGAWSAVNYALPEIRELAFRYCEEVCQRYDVDGIELDFFRHPVFFPSTTRGKLATPEELSMMTELISRIYDMAEREGRRRGRPILVAIHCPDSVEYCRAMGLALDEWMERGLFDIWIAAGTFQFNDWDYSAKLARQHGMKVYPSLDNPRVRDELAKSMRMTPLAYRGRAASALGTGVDGVALFNAFDVYDSEEMGDTLTREISSLETLSTLDRDYFGSMTGNIPSSSGNYPLDDFLNSETLNGRNPKTLSIGKPTDVRIFVGDQLPTKPAPKVTLRMRFAKAPAVGSIKATLNGQMLSLASVKGDWIVAELSPDCVLQGSNRVVLSLRDTANGKTPKTQIVDALLSVRFSDDAQTSASGQLDANETLAKADANGVAWLDPRTPPLHIAGLPWIAEEKVYRRLPLRPQWPIREEIDRLANSTSGGQIRFQSNSPEIRIRVKLLKSSSMNHMPPTGQSGFDLYLGQVPNQLYFGTTKFKARATEYEVTLFSGSKLNRHFTLNFPLYNGVKSVEIGVKGGATVAPPAPYEHQGRVVVYGTSVTQGGCAARPGMSYSNILSRRIDAEFVNLGFSGNGIGEPELAKLINQIPRKRMIVLDYEGNAGESIKESLGPFVNILRDGDKDIPILVQSKIRYAAELHDPDRLKWAEDIANFQEDFVNKRRDGGDKNIHFHNAGSLFGEHADECTVDGVHPTALGFMKIADGMEPVINKLLK